MTPLLLGYDVGTTRTKALVLDPATQRTVAVASRPTPVIQGARGDERDADTVFDLLTQLTSDLAAEIDLSTVNAVAVASLGEEVVLVDGNGRSIAPTPTWYAVDEHAVAQFDDGPAHREASFYKLASLHRRRPDLLAEAASFTDLGSYLEWRMVGGADSAVFMDLSHASRTAMLQPGSPTWSADRLRACGASALQPPELVSSGTVVGAVAAQDLLDAGIPTTAVVVAGGHDHFCGAYGAGIRSSGDAYVSVGTSESQLLIVDDLPAGEFRDAEAGYFVDAMHRYIHRSAPSGRRFAEILTRHGWAGDMDDLYTALGRRAGGEGSDDVPLLDEILAELREQAAASAAALMRLQELSGTRVRRIVVGGAPAQYALWRAIREEAAPMPLEFAPELELSAAGAALVAGTAVSRR